MARPKQRFCKRGHEPDISGRTNKGECRLCKRIRKRSFKRKDRRSERWRRCYKITVDDYKKLFERQNGKCFGCNKQTVLCVDHNHVTGVVRGLLCRKCNIALGFIEDNLTTLKNLVQYLESTI